MPRLLIDTESSRPAYRRRVAVKTLVAVVIVLVLAFATFLVIHRSYAVPGTASVQHGTHHV